MQERAHKIFSKHSKREIREWSRLLMKNYQLLYSVERPMNLDYAPGFANTSDLVQKIPNLSYRKAHSLKHQV